MQVHDQRRALEPARSASRWRPADFAIRGAFCPVTEIRSWAEERRSELNASALVILPCDGQMIIRSLALAACDDPADALRFESAVAATDFHRPRHRAVQEANELAAGLALGERRDGAVRRLRSALAGLTAEQTGGSVRWIERLEMVRLAGDHPSGVIHPLVLADAPSGRCFLNASASEDIAAMMNATAQASTHRDTRVMRQVDERIVPMNSTGAPVRFKDLARSAAELAVEVTGSWSAAVYVRDPEFPTGFQLSAVHAVPGSQPAKYRNPLPAVAGSLVYEVFEQRRPFQLPRSDAFSEMRPASGRRSRHSELGTPIPGPLASRDLPQVGVLVIARDRVDEFSAYDLALARNISLRLALLHSTAASFAIAHAIAELRKPSELRPGIAQSAPRGVARDLPPDIALGLKRVPDALKTLARRTNSQSATVRLAFGDFEATEPHGLALVRVAAHPAKRLNEEGAVQRETLHGGLNWRTARSGERTDAPDVSREPDYVEFRAGTVSELSVPIRYDGRLVGVLNLESQQESNYHSYITLVEAFAGAIGRSLADAGARHADHVLEGASQVIDRAHEVDYHVQEAIKKVRPDRQVADHLGDASRLLDRILRGSFDRASGAAGASIADVLAIGLSKESGLLAGTQDWGRESRASPELVRELDSYEAQKLAAAVGNVCKNMIRHTGSRRPRRGMPKRRMSIGSCRWDGRPYAAVSFFNVTVGTLDLADARRIYRAPYRSHGRKKLHLGAFLASLQMKQINGDVHFAVASGGFEARTTLLIPMSR